MRALCSILLTVVTGCGMITGLSDDYTFGDGGLGEGGADDGGGADGASGGEGGSCAISRRQFRPTTCELCLPESCCELAACMANEPCASYVRCRNACNNDSCIRNCENQAGSEARGQFATAVDRCVSVACRTLCNF